MAHFSNITPNGGFSDREPGSVQPEGRFNAGTAHDEISFRSERQIAYGSFSTGSGDEINRNRQRGNEEDQQNL